MISKVSRVSLHVSDDDTTYENIVQKSAVGKSVKLYSKVKSSSPPVVNAKTAKSLIPSSEVHSKVASVSKNKENLTIMTYAKQKSKTMKFIAAALFLGVLVLAVALVLVLYFMVIKNSDEKTDSNSTGTVVTTTAIPLPQVHTAPDVPGYPDPARSTCFIVTHWLPMFDFLTYGEHGVKAIGYFVTLKNEYFKLRKQIKDPALDIIVEKGTNLIEKMLIFVDKMHKLHYHDDPLSHRFEKYVGSLLKCISNKTTTCDSQENKLTQIIEAYDNGTRDLANISAITAETFDNFSNLLRAETLLSDMAHLLPKFLKGFDAYCKSLEKIFSTIFYKYNPKATWPHFPRFEKCEEYACLVIAERALDAWSRVDNMLRSAFTNQDSELTYWEDNHVAQQFMQISDSFTNDLKGQTAKILENWTCDI